MSKFEILTIIAAFGGLILSIINTVVILHENFKEPTLEVEVEKANIRCITEGWYDFQINIIMKSRNSDIFIRDVLLVAPDKDTFGSIGNLSDRIFLHKAIPLYKKDILDVSIDKFDEKMEILFSKDYSGVINLRDYKLPQDSQKSVTFCDRIEIFRWPDGYEDLSVKNWTLVILHKDGISETKFDFSKHYSSPNQWIK